MKVCCKGLPKNTENLSYFMCCHFLKYTIGTGMTGVQKFVLTALVYIHYKAPEFMRKCLLTETEHHRKQPVHTRLLCWVSNRAANRSHILYQKGRTNKDVTRYKCTWQTKISRYMRSKHACIFAVDIRPTYLIAQSCSEVSSVSQDHKWYHITYRLFIPCNRWPSKREQDC